MMEATQATTFWISIALALLLWGLLSFAEWKREGSAKTWLRIILLLSAIGALWAIWYQPTYTVNSKEATIILNEAEDSLVDSVLAVYPAASVLSLQTHKQFTFIEGLSYLKQHAPAGAKVMLLGEAVSANEQHFLKDFQVEYLPNSSIAGLHSLKHSHNSVLGDSLTIWGQWLPAAPDEKLLLTMGTLPLDSLKAQSVKKQDFTLSTQLFIEGDQRYQLYRLNQQGDTLATHQLGLKVGAAKPLSIALLTAYPEAESKYLKEMLVKQGHKLYYAAQLGPGKQLEEWHQLERSPFRLQRAAQKDFDLFIISAGYWNGLGTQQQQALQESQRSTGLGILIYPDAETRRITWQNKTISFSDEVVKDSLLLANESVSLEFYPIINKPKDWQPVVSTTQKPVTISHTNGLGIVLVSTAVYTYRLQLQGKQQDYVRFWQRLLQEVTPLNIKQTYLALPHHASEHMPLDLRLQSNDSLPTFQLIDANRQPVKVISWQDPVQPYAWRYRMWPQNTGWYTAIAGNDTSSFRIKEESTGLQKFENRKALNRFELQQLAQGRLAQTPNKSIQQLVPLWWFYVIFLGSMGGLWLEKKLQG